jgi:hypothetical protein
MVVLPKVLAAILLLSIVLPSEADAQSRRRKIVTRLKGAEITGTVQGPEVARFFRRQNLSANEQLELRESFLPRIIESVEKKPF